MLRFLATRLRRAREGERGAVLVITAAAMFTMLVIAAFAIDVAIWYVHGKHLQTEADAAALAGAQLFQFPCTSGASSPGTTDNSIQNLVNDYDGTKAPPTGTFYNPQVNVEPTPATIYSPTVHNLFSELNAPQFENQNLPNPGDSLTGSPCTDSAIDVKMTETNLPSYFPFINPSYLNKEAEVAIENETSGQNVSPLAEPLPTPAYMTAYLVDEGNNDSLLGTVPMTAVSGTNDAQWNGTANFAFNATGPIGMEIATSNGPTITSCATAPNCYDATDTPNIGVAYTHVWTPPTGTVNFPTTAPALQDATIAPTSGAGGCPGTAGAGFSNFISTSTSCTVMLSANLQFGSTATCAQATAMGTSFAVSYSGTNYAGGSATLNPPAACSSPGASPNGTWTSAAIPVPPGGTIVGTAKNPFTGPIPLTLQFAVTTGLQTAYPFTTGGDHNGNCKTNNQCIYNFSNGSSIQRIFSGGFNDESIAGDNAGPILAASINDPTNGNAAIQSIQNNATAQPISVNVTVESFQNSQSITPLSAPLELAFGGNQQNALVSCPGGSAGQPQAEVAIWQGCPSGSVAIDTNETATPCNPLQNAAGAYFCLSENSGNGKLDAVLDTAMQCKINGSSSTTACNPVAGCNSPNYWASGNNLNQLLNENPADPRLLALFTTDNGAFANGRTQVPIRVITDFYVTGWAPIVANGPNANPNGDPCIGKAPGHNTVTMKDGSTAMLNYVGDDSPSASDSDPSGVLLGHFVRYTVIGPGTGSGSCSESGSLGNCIGILTK